ncbi:hypothetical protein, conserved [Eimeria necatrix]|uniref:Longin domain-containing protein n=1 Tax=Eimeria necatrix TaxID=51315 RepID=U6MTN3_9EIME|nr:hypothetical protein, conserved [Eimeria necatrix]CDJ65829.1 hypothetical protein, conserved [Eimeria necatrix]
MNSQQEVEHEGLCAFVFRYPNSLAALAVGDKEYPRRVAFACLNEVYLQFTQSVPASKWRSLEIKKEKNNKSNNPEIDFGEKMQTLLKKYKNPALSDQLVQAQLKADRAQEVVRQTVVSVLRQGESLQELINKSEDLSVLAAAKCSK